MAKDTKNLLIQTLLTIAKENGPLTVEEISRRSGITRNTIQRNFNNEGVKGIVYYIDKNITQEINEQLFKFDPDELPSDMYAKNSLPWIKERYTRILKKHGLNSFFSPSNSYWTLFTLSLVDCPLLFFTISSFFTKSSGF